AAYSLQPGDTVFVDVGNYDLLRGVTIEAQHRGVRIQGPTSGVARLNRGLTLNGSPVIDLRGASDVTLDRLHVTGGQHGVFAADNARSLRLTVSNSTVYGNYERGIRLGTTNDFATITGNTVYGVPGGPTTDDQQYGIDVNNDGAAITRNTTFDH